MNALVLTAYNELKLINTPCPEIKPDEVLVKITAAGICGSDVHGMDGTSGRRQPPIIMGHEAAGTIVETGPKVSSWKKGDRITFDSTIYCGRCFYCRRGMINLCNNRRVLGVSCDEYHCDGAFAEYLAVPERILYRLPDAVSFEFAAMVEPLSVAFHALQRSEVRLGDKALVLGAGVIGLLVVQLLKAAGCSQIIAVDIDDKRLETARKIGADQVFNGQNSDTPAGILELSGGGVDLAFECVGLEKTVNSAVNLLRKRGNLTLVGNISPNICFPLQKIVTREISIKGSCASSYEYPVCLDLIASGRINPAPLISAVVPLAKGAEYFKLLYRRSPELIKVILKP